MLALAPVSYLEKFKVFSNWIWGKLNIDILWQWLPNDIQLWIGTFIGVMFLVAFSRVVRG